MSKYRSEDEDVIVENPAAGEGEEISAVPTAEPDMPPTSTPDPVNPVESTRAPEADPTVPEQRFRFRSEGEEVEAPAAPADAPAAPAAPMDAPAAPAADAAPADAPAAPAAPAVVPADVPAAAPMAEPQPDAEVAPAAPAEGVAPAAPVAPEVAATPEVGAVEPAPAAPAEEAPVDNAAPQARFKQEGEEISVVATPDPRTPAETETATCPETGDQCVDKDIKEPINPVIEQEDELAEDVSTEAPAPAEEPTKDDITAITPETAEDDDAAIAEIDQCMRMEDEAEVEAGDQDVNATVNVNVRKDDGDEHAEDTAETGAEVSDDGDQAPEQCGGSKKLFKSEGDQIETVADIVDAPPAEDVVPVPDPNAGSPDASGDPDQVFGQFMQEGGDWL